MARRILFSILLATAAVSAHPMGNFSVSHYAKFRVEADRVRLDYALDLAEIPTFELLQDWNLTAGSPRSQLHAKAAAQAQKWAKNLVIKDGGSTLHPVFDSADVATADGAGNMPVMRITAHFHLPATGGRLDYEDKNYAERAGWKEVVVTSADSVRLIESSAPATDRSNGLTSYPQDPTAAPPQVVKAAFRWDPPKAVAKDEPVVAAAPVVQPAPVEPKTPAASGAVVKDDYLSRLLHRKDIPFTMLLIGIAVAFGLGAIHALSPGHGKTMVAAYLVGSRGTAAHAMLLGATVTFTHTISVFLLGFVTLFLSQYILPDQLYPILGAISGVTIVWVGGTMLYRRTMRLRPHADSHDHHHHHDHSHDHHHHHDHDHDHHHHHGPGGHTHMPEGDITIGSLIALGASGGLVPCPSGLVLLLSSIAIGRVGLGLTLLVGFSAGLAVVLTSIGLLVVYAKHLLPTSDKTQQHPLFRLVPVASAAIITVVGILMTGVSLGLIRPGGLIG